MNKITWVVLGIMALLVGANCYDGSITAPWEASETGYLNGPSVAPSGGNASGLLVLFALLPDFLKFGLLFAVVGLFVGLFIIGDLFFGNKRKEKQCP